MTHTLFLGVDRNNTFLVGCLWFMRDRRGKTMGNLLPNWHKEAD